jgi:cytochrome c553
MTRHFAFAALLLAVATTCAAQTATPVGDAARGREKTRMCEGCHGIDGWRIAYPVVFSVPRIGGQHAAYIEKALHEYKSGERQFASMRAIATTLSDQDIADLAAYYSQSATTTASK